jgi:hypothetical protein
MQNVFWLIPGKVAGRTGPNIDPWDPAQLKENGIGAVLSVNSGILVDATALEACGICYACIPFSWNAPPIPGDVEICLDALPKAFAFVQDNIEAGRAVMIHSKYGIWGVGRLRESMTWPPNPNKNARANSNRQ